MKDTKLYEHYANKGSSVIQYQIIFLLLSKSQPQVELEKYFIGINRFLNLNPDRSNQYSKKCLKNSQQLQKYLQLKKTEVSRKPLFLCGISRESYNVN